MSERYICPIHEVGIDEINRVIQWFCDSIDGKLSEAMNTFRGLYLACCGNSGLWLAVDNLTGRAWTEVFDNRDAAVDWLRDYR